MNFAFSLSLLQITCILALITRLSYAQIAPSLSQDYLNPKNSFFKLTSLPSKPFKDVREVVSVIIDGDSHHDLLAATQYQLFLYKNITNKKSLENKEVISEGNYSLLSAIGTNSFQTIFAYSSSERKGVLFESRYATRAPYWNRQDAFSLQEFEAALKIQIGQVINVKVGYSSQNSSDLIFVISCTDTLTSKHLLLKSTKVLGHKTYVKLLENTNEFKLHFFDFSTSEFIASKGKKVFMKNNVVITLDQKVIQVFPYRTTKDNQIFVLLIEENPFVLHLKKDSYGNYIAHGVKLQQAYQKQSIEDNSKLKNCLQFMFLDFQGFESRNYLCQMNTSLKYVFEFPVIQGSSNSIQGKSQDIENIHYGLLDLDVFRTEAKPDDSQLLYTSKILKLDHSTADGQVFLVQSPKGFFTMQSANPNFDDLWDTNFWFVLMTYSFFMILIFGSIHFYCFGEKTLAGTGLLEDEKNSSEEGHDSFELPFKVQRKTTI